MRRPLLVCEAVLSESCFLLASLPQAHKQLRLWMQSDYIRHAPLDGPLVGRALALMERYVDVPMSFADACVVALAEQNPAVKVFTVDRDFLIYRKLGSEPLMLLAPFTE